MTSDQRSFADMLATTRREQTDRKVQRDDLPRINRFRASFDSECVSMIAGRQCDGDISEGDEIGYVDDEIACESCCDHAQEIRDDFFDR